MVTHADLDLQLRGTDQRARTARPNDASEWVSSEVPSMRMVTDALWARARERDVVIGDLYENNTSNRLTATRRPEYLLSRMLECAECGGPFAISGKERYSCTNRKKRLPIDELGGFCCGNSKTITRHELEDRVLNCIPAAFYPLATFDRISEKMIAHEVSVLKPTPSRKASLEAELGSINTAQKSLMQQIHRTGTLKAGRALPSSMTNSMNWKPRVGSWYWNLPAWTRRRRIIRRRSQS